MSCPPVRNPEPLLNEHAIYKRRNMSGAFPAPTISALVGGFEITRSQPE